MWPIEGLPQFLRYIGYYFPFSVPITAFRNILAKNSTICNFHVYMSFVVLFSWIGVLVLLSTYFIERQEKSRKL
jgi:ABC-type polysaccharide/polyol phosphate export permease